MGRSQRGPAAASALQPLVPSRLAGKLFDERLAALGGDRLLPIGLGDDDGTMEDDYASWKDRLWPALAAAAGGSAAASTAAAAAATAGDAETDAPTLAWSVVPVPAPTGAPTPAAVNAAAADLGSRHFYIAHTARVTACRELRRGPVEPGDSTRHIELDIGGAPYATADNLYVLPENDAATVKAVARWLGFDLDMWFTLEAADKQAPPAAPPFPVPCSVRDALTHYCDLHGAPRKELVAELAPFAASADERAAMRALAHRDGKARWAELVSGPQRSVVELLQLFPSLRLPLGAFVELAPRLMPRAYTIASSALVHPASVHVCSRVVDTPKPGGDASRRLRGVCSTFLARAQPGATMRVYVRPSTFRLPADVSVPIILVGPGIVSCHESESQQSLSRHQSLRACLQAPASRPCARSSKSAACSAPAAKRSARLFSSLDASKCCVSLNLFAALSVYVAPPPPVLAGAVPTTSFTKTSSQHSWPTGLSPPSRSRTRATAPIRSTCSTSSVAQPAGCGAC